MDELTRSLSLAGRFWTVLGLAAVAGISIVALAVYFIAEGVAWVIGKLL